MSQPDPPPLPRPTVETRPRIEEKVEKVEKVLCDRCGADMFRIHAVWRCPSCGYKTDCCGW